MDLKKQKLLIEYLLSSADVFSICQGIIEPDYFDPELRNSIRFIQEYNNEYNALPAPSQIEAETNIKLGTHDIKRDQIEYCTTEVEKFVKRRALEKAVIAAGSLIKEGDYSLIETKIKDAILISLNKNLGLRYFDDPEERLKRMLQENPTIPTGWDDVDEILFGGISRKELLLVSANSGGGKSITLTNLGLNFIESGHNVLYVSLELAEEIVAQRVDTMVTGIGRRVWKHHIPELVARITSKGQVSGTGILDIVQMKSGTRPVEIQAYLKEYILHHGIVPDLLVIDYLDKMRPNEKNIDMSDVWTKDKLCSEQSRDLGVEYNMCIATASQLNRDAVKAAVHDHSHIAGGISKINESDIYWSIRMTDVMKAAGECSFLFQKTRNSDGDGKTVHLRWNSKNLRIENLKQKPELTFKRDSGDNEKDTFSTTAQAGQGLIDLMSGI